ncbi:MAG: OmpA family protein [Candidatus Hydrogenedentales bacterium]|jgi:outer membrane protein OmpA-like peptidoglycan-associated protein
MQKNNQTVLSRTLSSCGVLLLLCAVGLGCATTGSVIVLVPDPDGQLGSASVSNSGGSTTLARAGDSTSVKSSSSAPGAPQAMNDASIQKIFAPALAAEPPQPLKFLVYFERDSAEPDTNSTETVKQILAAIKERDSRDISVVGHTDRSGDDAHNLKLSIERATRVRDILVKDGVGDAIIEVESHGEGNPLIPTADNVIEPRNRRVEVVVR